MRLRGSNYYNDQADKILKQAEKDGVLNNFLFVTSFDRYIDQAKRLEEITKELERSGYSVEKTYNGSTNEVASAAYRNYITICDRLDKTAALLTRITDKFKCVEKETKDPIIDILNGGQDD